MRTIQAIAIFYHTTFDGNGNRHFAMSTEDMGTGHVLKVKVNDLSQARRFLAQAYHTYDVEIFAQFEQTLSIRQFQRLTKGWEWLEYEHPGDAQYIVKGQPLDSFSTKVW